MHLSRPAVDEYAIWKAELAFAIDPAMSSWSQVCQHKPIRFRPDGQRCVRRLQ